MYVFDLLSCRDDYTPFKAEIINEDYKENVSKNL